MINEQLDGQLRMATLDPLEGKQFQVRKRNGNIIDFDETRIYLAIEAALKADAELDQDTPADETMQAAAQRLTQAVVEKSLSRASDELSPWLAWKVYDVLFALLLLYLGKRVRLIRQAQELDIL